MKIEETNNKTTTYKMLKDGKQIGDDLIIFIGCKNDN